MSHTDNPAVDPLPPNVRATLNRLNTMAEHLIAKYPELFREQPTEQPAPATPRKKLEEENNAN